MIFIILFLLKLSKINDDEVFSMNAVTDQSKILISYIALLSLIWSPVKGVNKPCPPATPASLAHSTCP